MSTAAFVLAVALAVANGANDVPKGVATLAGARVTSYRKALLWGSGATAAGGLLAAVTGGRLVQLFSAGIVDGHPAAALPVLIGAGAWVLAASRLGLPVSTTHALVGGLVGAGLASSQAGPSWGALAGRVLVPMVVAVPVAYAASAALRWLLRPLAPPLDRCICVGVRPGLAVVPTGDGAASLAGPPTLAVVTGDLRACRAHAGGGRAVAVTVDSLHLLSAAAASFARAMNDVPKIAALAVMAGIADRPSLAVVAVAMALGGIGAGARVARRLGDGIVAMGPHEGAQANAVTASLVAGGSVLGVPLAITHVGTAAIAGVAGSRGRGLRWHSIRDIAIAWTLTPAAAGAVAACTAALLRTGSAVG